MQLVDATMSLSLVDSEKLRSRAIFSNMPHSLLQDHRITQLRQEP